MTFGPILKGQSWQFEMEVQEAPLSMAVIPWPAACLVTSVSDGDFLSLTEVSKKLALIWPISEMDTLVNGQAFGLHRHDQRQ